MRLEYKLCDKYTAVYSSDGYITEVLRYGKEWMTKDDVIGNNLLNALLQRILELEQELKSHD